MKKKENIAIIVLLLVMAIAIIGVSYAAFSYSGLGSKVNSITTGSITMTYTETDNTISLTGALPTADKTGMVRMNPGEYFDFNVSSEIMGNVNINYEISAKDITVLDGEQKKMDGSLRLIYNGISSLPSNHGLSNSYLIGIAPYNLNWNDPKYTGYTYDNGTDSFIKREVDTWYGKTLGDTIYDRMVTGGRFCSDSSG